MKIQHTYYRYWDIYDTKRIVRTSRSVQRDPGTLYYLVQLRGLKNPQLFPAEEVEQKIPQVLQFYKEHVSSV